MILIWGFRSRAKTLSEGDFFCPACGTDRRYILQEIRRWFTLFFIPLFPTGKPYGDQVKCQVCNTCYRPEILNAPTSASFTMYMRNAMRLAAVTMVRAGGASNGPARTLAVQTVRDTGTADFDEAALDRDLAQFETSQLPAYFAPLASGLKEQGKEAFVTQLVRIGAIDGRLTEQEMAVIETVAAALQLSIAHLRGIVSSVESPEVSPYDAP